MAALLDQVDAALDGLNIGSGSRLCLALSGGRDSVVLLDLLCRLRQRRGFTLVAAHVHHGLSPNADRWQAFCAEVCQALAVSFVAHTVDVRPDHPQGLEAAARAVRHQALAQVDCDWLVFAHHRDDQAETVLFRLLRGTGVHGLAAMRPHEPGRPGRLRPLLHCPQALIAEYARTHGLKWVEDESNADPVFTRNFLRHRVFPVLRERLPGATAALARAAGHLNDTATLLDDLASIDVQRCGGQVLSRAALLALRPARALNLLRYQVRQCGAALPSQARLAEALRQLGHSGSLCCSLGEAVLAAYDDKVSVFASSGRSSRDDYSTMLHPDDLTGSVDWFDGEVRWVMTGGSGVASARIQAGTQVCLTTRWAGLRMRLAPDRPRRTFKNLCQEAAIPDWLRNHLPVLRVDDEPVWIAGIGVAAGWACEPDETGIELRWDCGPLAVFIEQRA